MFKMSGNAVMDVSLCSTAIESMKNNQALLNGVCFQIFYPETTDVYDRKNMPKVIYCIHALR